MTTYKMVPFHKLENGRLNNLAITFALETGARTEEELVEFVAC